MIKFRTKTSKDFEYDRVLRNDIIYVEVKIPEFGNDIVRPKGRYYFVNENGANITLSEFKGFISWNEVMQIEDTYLPTLQSDNILDCIKQRIGELTLLRIDQEATSIANTNWGITSQDLEEWE